MNVELDKHDLFRNVIPGYVFLIVILSFYAVTSRIDSIKETPKAIIGLIAGFPVGFLIHALYRIIFHFWSFWKYEQREMEQEDADLADKFSNIKEFQAINNWFLKAYGEIKDDNLRRKTRAKALSHVFDRTLSRNKESEAFSERIYFLISFIHSLGASAFAIILAVLFVFFFKLPLWHPLWWHKLFYWKEYHFEGGKEVVLSLIWILEAGILYWGRKSSKEAFSAAKKAFYLNE